MGPRFSDTPNYAFRYFRVWGLWFNVEVSGIGVMPGGRGKGGVGGSRGGLACTRDSRANS